MVSRLPRDERRAQLIEAALLVFSRDGFDAGSLDAVAATAGVSRRLAYHYFATKRDLYVECVRLASDRLLAATGISAEAPGMEPAVAMEAYLDWAEAHALPYLTLLSGGLHGDAAVGDIVERHRDAIVTRMLAGTDPAGRPLAAAAARGWVAFVETVAVNWLREPSAVARSQVRDLCVAMHGATLDAAQRAMGPRPG